MTTDRPDDGTRYRCAACKTPIRHGDRCRVCRRGWFVEEIPPAGPTPDLEETR